MWLMKSGGEWGDFSIPNARTVKTQMWQSSDLVYIDLTQFYYF